MLDYTTTEKISRLNDCFRRSTAFGGSVLLTPGVSCLAPDRLAESLQAVRTSKLFVLFGSVTRVASLGPFISTVIPTRDSKHGETWQTDKAWSRMESFAN